jgi:hypothetical protein
MDEQAMDDARMGERLRQLYALEVDRSGPQAAKLLADVIARPTVRPPALRSHHLGSLTVLVVAIAVAAVLLRTGPPLNQGTGGAAPGSPVTTPVAPAVGPTVATSAATADGIPTTIDGQPVLFGSAAAKAIAASTDATPLLVGGWFHDAKATPDRVCPAVLIYPWGPCDNFELFTGKTGSDAIWILDSRPYPPIIDELVVSASTRAVVLRIHTHDPLCRGDASWCLPLPIADEIVWTGPKN